MKLAIAQMVLGGLIVANWLTLGIPWSLYPSLWSVVWPFPEGYQGGALSFWSGHFLRIIREPFWMIFLVSGLAVLGCGIAQFLKARKARSKDEHFNQGRWG